MGGAFAADGGSPFAAHGAVAGLAKTLAQEWQGVRVRAIDLDPQDSAEALAGYLEAELWASDGALEAGYRQGRRHVLDEALAPVARSGEPEPGPDWVWLVTGGARGITAESAPSYLALRNVGCVGGSWITPRSALAEGRWDVVASLAAEAASLTGG